MNGALKMCGRKQSCFVLRYYLRISLKKLTEICDLHKTYKIPQYFNSLLSSLLKKKKLEELVFE